MRRTDTETPARLPDESGHVERDGVRVSWDAYGTGDRALLLLPAWSIVHSRLWKAQIHYLARHFRVVTFDGRGNGLSDRPDDPAAYADPETVADAVAVLDAAGVGQAIAVGMSCGGRFALALAAAHPERVGGVVAIAPAVPLLTPGNPDRERVRLRGAARRLRGVGKGQPPPLARRLPGLPGVLLRPDVQRTPLVQADR